MNENSKFKILDYTHYDPAKCRNGGAYGYEEIFEVKAGEAVNGYHWTTADFEYCPLCGRFERHLQEHLERFHDGENDYWPSETAKMAARIIAEAGFEAAQEFVAGWGNGLELVQA